MASRKEALAQELQRLLGKAKKPASVIPIRRAPMDGDERVKEEDAPVEQEPAQEVTEQPATGESTADVNTQQEAAEMATAQGRKGRAAAKGARKATRKRDTSAKPRARREKKAGADEVQRDPTTGLNKKPKGRILFINRAPALDLVERLLKKATKDGDLSTEEQFESTRLLARIAARK